MSNVIYFIASVKKCQALIFGRVKLDTIGISPGSDATYGLLPPQFQIALECHHLIPFYPFNPITPCAQYILEISMILDG